MRRLRTACPKHRREIKLGKIESEVQNMIPHYCHLLLFCLNSKVLRGRTFVNISNPDVAIIIILKGGKMCVYVLRRDHQLRKGILGELQ
jgi:hypothetical protein